MFIVAAHIRSKVPTVLSGISFELNQTAEDINAKGDIQEFIERSISAVVAPTPLEYIPYETDNTNFKILSDTACPKPVSAQAARAQEPKVFFPSSFSATAFIYSFITHFREMETKETPKGTKRLSIYKNNSPM